MLAGGISVPSYTTYTTKDYEYIINDCEPSVVIVSNKEQFKKVKDILEQDGKYPVKVSWGLNYHEMKDITRKFV